MTKPDETEPWKDMEHLPWLHIYGQYMWHSPATIRGSRSGLESLRAARDTALDTGAGSGEVVATDGEGYAVMVNLVTLVSAMGTPEYGIQAEDSAREREYNRAARNDLYALGYPQKPASQIGDPQ